YIAFVNPQILAAAGMDRDAVFVATCLAATFGSAFMGLYARYPIAVAPGMGLNAYFAYTVVGTMGYSWQVALAAVFISGVLFLIISILPIRAWVINAIPPSQKLAISAGIGLLLGIIALENAGMVVDDPSTLITVGDLADPKAILAGVGFIIIVALDYHKIPGAILIGILAITAAAMIAGLAEPQGLFALPSDPSPALLQLDFTQALELGLVTIAFTFLLLNFFDSSGTLIGVAQRAGFLDKDGHMPRLRRALVVDSSATIVGAALGTSTTTAYVESATGVRAGGRTGLTAVVVAFLFLIALFFGPLAASVPSYATAPAILFIACVMAQGIAELDWTDITESAPGMVTAIGIPFTFSISTGIGMGFIAYVAIKLLAGRLADTSPAMIIVAAIFILKFAIS
ncbi:MAG: NCS2 family permease, partial [Pseudomonadota bacterium]